MLSWGLGETVVAGRVTPDTYVVRKRDLAVVSRLTADKRVIAIAAAVGTRDAGVPRVLRKRPVLDAPVGDRDGRPCTRSRKLEWDGQLTSNAATASRVCMSCNAGP